MANKTTLINNVAWDGNEKWPYTNRIFNVASAIYPEKRFNSASYAPNQRNLGYPNLPVNFMSRGMPQLTWFKGDYDIRTEAGSGTDFCRYPHLIGAPDSSGRRKCLIPGRATAADLRRAAAAKKKREDSMAAEISRGHDPRAAGCSSGQSEYYSDNNAYSCSTGKLLRTGSAITVRGLDGIGALGETQVQKDKMKEMRNLYLTTELALAGLMLAGAFFVWKK